MASVNQVMRRVREIDSVIQDMQDPEKELDREELSGWLIDYQQMLLKAEVKL